MSIIRQRIIDSINVKKELLNNEVLIDMVGSVSEAIVKAINNGGKIVLCGNGGSASDTLHFAGEI